MTFWFGVLVGIGVGQLIVLAAAVITYKPTRYWEAEPPTWLCLSCWSQWLAAQRRAKHD